VIRRAQAEVNMRAAGIDVEAIKRKAV